MSDQQQRTLWAVGKFRDFVKAWTPPAARNQLLEPQRWKVTLDDDLRDGERVIRAIQAKRPAKPLLTNLLPKRSDTHRHRCSSQ